MASILFFDDATRAATLREGNVPLYRLTPSLEEVAVTRISRRRMALVAVGLIAAFSSLSMRAPAALDLSVGVTKVVKDRSVSACNGAAKSALNSVLQNAVELGGDTGEWEGYGAADSANGSTVAAAIHCYPLDGAYVVTFTCAAQVPPSPDSASALCSKLAAAFDLGAQL